MSARRSLGAGAMTAVALALAAPGVAWGQAAASAYTWATRVDAAGRVTGTIAPDPDGTGALAYAATRTSYDAAGRAVLVERGELSAWQSDAVAPAAWSGFAVFAKVATDYDALGRKLVETSWGKDPASGVWVVAGVTQYSYDSVGRPECTAVRLNASAWGALPGSACTAQVAGSFGPDRIVRTVYDAAGRVVTEQRAYGTALQQDYASYSYTANGKASRVIDADGNVAGYGYDGFDRLVKWSFPSTTSPGAVSTSDYEAYGYDANGNRTSLRKRDGSVIGYTYDSLNRVTVKDVPGGTTADVYYGYDLRGLQLSARFGSATGANAVSQGYDGFGRLASETVAMGGVSRTVGYGYDRDGDRTRVTYPDAVNVDYAYDGLDRTTAVLVAGTTATASMAYDARGQLASETRGNVTTTLTYDPVSRPASIADDLPGTAGDVTSGYAYSPASQIVTRSRSNDAYAFTGYVTASKAYGVNALNQYTSVGSASQGYDANGNLTSDGTTTYTYDVENRLTGTSTGASLTYDPLGRLYRITDATSDERFAYAGDQRIAAYDASGALTDRYVFGPGDDNVLLAYGGSGTTSPIALQGDHQGSIVSSVTAGGTIGYNSYDEYGVPAVTNTGRFQYTGQAWLPQVGLYYYKARFYDPRGNRFLQTDPISYEDQMNLYAYVGNDPILNTDPKGKDTTCNKNRTMCITYLGSSKQPKGGKAVVADNVDPSNRRSRRAHGTSMTDLAASEVAGILNQRRGNERLYRMDQVNTASGPIVFTTEVFTKNPTPQGATVIPGSLDGATAVLHTEPTQVGSTGFPGVGDWTIPDVYGLANYQVYGSSVNVIEQDDGAVSIRSINQSGQDRGTLKRLVNTFQKRLKE